MDKLMMKRVKVQEFYPSSPYSIGDILTLSIDGNYWAQIPNSTACTYPIHEIVVDKCPAIFKPLTWYEDRELSEMPEYLKLYSKVFKVEEWCGYNEIGQPLYKRFNDANYLMTYCVSGTEPATKEDYEEYIKNK